MSRPHRRILIRSTCSRLRNSRPITPYHIHNRAIVPDLIRRFRRHLSEDDGIRTIPATTAKRTLTTAHSDRVSYLGRRQQHHLAVHSTLVANITDTSVAATSALANTATQHVPTRVWGGPTKHALWPAGDASCCHGCHRRRRRVFVSVHALGSQPAAVAEDVGRWRQEGCQGRAAVASADVQHPPAAKAQPGRQPRRPERAHDAEPRRPPYGCAPSHVGRAANAAATVS